MHAARDADRAATCAYRRTVPRAVQIMTLLREYLESGDAAEAGACIAELQLPQYDFYLVKRALTLAMDRKDRDREAVSVLLSNLYGQYISPAMMQKVRAAARLHPASCRACCRRPRSHRVALGARTHVPRGRCHVPLATGDPRDAAAAAVSRNRRLFFSKQNRRCICGMLCLLCCEWLACPWPRPVATDACSVQ